jgi:SAM-dependent methyltransferase
VHPFTWDDIAGAVDDGERLLPDALQVGRRRLVEADIYDAGDWYDVDYAGYLGELRFYRQVCDAVVPRDGVIVELGAGTGRLTLPLAAGGRRLHAVEPAASMRARLLHKRSRQGPDGIVVEDALGHTFVGPPSPALVIFPFNGILHVRGRAALDETLHHIRRRLVPGGRLAVDLTGPYWESIRRGRIPWGRVDERVHPTTGVPFLTCDRSAYHGASRLMRIDIRYAPGDGDDLIQTALFQYMWTTTEILAAVVDAGFAVEEAFGDVDLGPFHEGAPRLLLVARAP